MLDYVFLKLAWWVIIGLVLMVYACTAGFDKGLTMYMPFLKNEMERRLVLNVSAPTWDGNLSWIVFAGGGLFVIWPVVYSTAFSGMYAAMLLILFSLFLRPPGYDYRNKIDSALWRRICDWALFLSGFIPVFVFGVAMGNCFLGFPFHYDPETFRSYWTGNFWDLLSPYALLSGFIAVVMVLMHGSVYLQRRTRGRLVDLGYKIQVNCAIFLLITLSISGFLLIFVLPGYKLVSSPQDAPLMPLANQVIIGAGYWIDTYRQYPWKCLAPLSAYAGIIVAWWASAHQLKKTAFWASCFGVGGIVATGGATLFPFLMPSSTDPSQSLTVWNAVSTQYALNIMFYIGVVLLLVILAYKIYAYRAIWSHKPYITEEDVIRDEDKVFY